MFFIIIFEISKNAALPISFYYIIHCNFRNITRCKNDVSRCGFNLLFFILYIYGGKL